MKHKSATPRSYLRRLAEPMPRTAVPLMHRRPAIERGAATRSSLDAIPPILDVTEAINTFATELQPTQAASSSAKPVAPRRSKTSARPDLSHSFTITGESAVRVRPTKQSSASLPEAVLPNTTREHTTTQTKTPFAAIQENAQLQPVLGHSASAQPTPPLSLAPPQTTAKSERRQDISVHIGTIEVRVPAPPTRIAERAPAALNPRNIQHAVPSRASEPLSRGLTWMQGLIQG
jgi:hypothetical protein